MKRIPLILAIPLLALLLALGATDARAGQHRPEELRIGLIPALSPQRFVQGFGKMVTYLEQRLDVDVVLVGAPNYAEFIRRAGQGGHYDVLVTGSEIYRYLDRTAGYRAIVRLGGDGNYAIIATAADSGLKTLEDLKGTTIATADPLSLSRRLGEKTLRQAGVILGENAVALVTPTQNASMSSILSGLADAAIFMDPVIRRAPPEVVARLHVIAESERAMSHPLSVAPSLPDAFVDELRAALLDMPNSPLGAAFFDDMKWPEFIAAQPEEFAVMDWALEAIEQQMRAAGSD